MNLLKYFQSRKRLFEVAKELRRRNRELFLEKESVYYTLSMESGSIKTWMDRYSQLRDDMQSLELELEKYSQYKDKYYKLIAAIKINDPEFLDNKQS